MTFSDVTVLTALALSVVVFYLLASRARGESLTVLGYTLADRQIGQREFGASLVAASTSLATVLLFFLSTANYYGLVLLWCGLTYFLGQAIFLKYVTGKPLLGRDIRTISDLWYGTILSPLNARLITAITVSSFLIILFVELYIGSIILTYFIRPMVPAYADALGFAFMSLLVIGYVRIGGLRGVMQTDQWQLKMLLAAVLALALFALIAVPQPAASGATPWYFALQAGPKEIILFCVWILILNLTLPFSQLSSWQRVAAAKSPEEVWAGFKSHAKFLLFAWIVPVLAFVYLVSRGYVFGDVTQLFQALRSAGGITDGILYPIIVVGFGAALFSTADTALIALGTALADNNTFRGPLERMSEKRLRGAFTVFALLTLGVLTVVFAIAEADVGAWFIPLIYAIFGQLVVVAPLVLYSLRRIGDAPKEISSLGSYLVAAGLLVGWVVIMVAVFIDQNQGTYIWSQLAAPASFLISGGFLLLGVAVGNARPVSGTGSAT